MSISLRSIAITALALIASAPVLRGQGAVAAAPGEVISIQGEIINVHVRSGPAPAVGDTLTVMNRPDAEGNATSIGRWRVTEVRGRNVKAILVQRHGGTPSEGMPVFFAPSRGRGLREGPGVEMPGSASSGVPGKVTEVRGEDVTIRLLGEAAPAIGDRVELRFTVGEDVIAVGTWRITGVRGDGRVDAGPVDVRGQPTPNMDAVVWATGRKADSPPSKGGPPGTPAGLIAANRLFEEAMRISAKDPARSVALLVEAAGMGHAGAAEKAGIAYWEGRSVARDDARAAALIRQAAEAGRPVAQNYYGACFGTGRGVPKDNAQAVFWFRRAAEGGESWAQANLCVRYETGDGVKKDLDKALRFCRLSAEQNNPMALDQLGWMYQRGSGVEKDLTKAYQYYRRSAELGFANGQNNLAYVYSGIWAGSTTRGSA